VLGSVYHIVAQVSKQKIAQFFLCGWWLRVCLCVCEGRGKTLFAERENKKCVVRSVSFTLWMEFLWIKI